MNWLFICAYGISRSLTAAKIFSGIWVPGDTSLTQVHTCHLGLNTDYLKQKNNNLLLDWSDVIFVMEFDQQKIFKDTEYFNKVRCLDIPDMYLPMTRELIEILKEQVAKATGLGEYYINQAN